MGLYSERPKRLVLPRWRDFKETSKTAELSKEKNAHSPILPKLSVQENLANWNKQKSVANAIELVSSAFLINNPEPAFDAANYILKNCKDIKSPIRVIANLILTKDEKDELNYTPAKLSFENFQYKIQKKIQGIRARLKVYPQNSMLCVDLARWYAVIGKVHEAQRCITTALQLSPQNIFVIRSAIRFYIYKSKHDKKHGDSLLFALQLIRKNPATKTDPWLMATEISLCSYLEKTSLLIKSGLSLIDARKFSPFALSELSSALATVELNHNVKKSKKLFTSSLINPNENTIAQAQWATEIVGDLPLDFDNYNSYEANSYESFHAENWETAFDESLNWVIDQPFSSDPVNHASYLASAIIDDNDLSVKICDFGLRSNPKEFTLLNNKAYSLAVEKHVEEAEKTFNQINISELKDEEKISYIATKGLLYYANGDHETGNSLYAQAEAYAIKIKNEKAAIKVKIYKTRTEFIFVPNKKDEKTALTNLLKDYKNFKHPDINKIIDNIIKRLGVTEVSKPTGKNTVELKL